MISVLLLILIIVVLFLLARVGSINLRLLRVESILNSKEMDGFNKPHIEPEVKIEKAIRVNNINTVMETVPTQLDTHLKKDWINSEKANEKAAPIVEHMFEFEKRIQRFFKAKIINYLITGNIPAKIGSLLLIIGFGFLLKYTAQYIYIPIGLRFIAVALASLGMITAGWFLRDRKHQFGLILQGGGIGILYLTIFFSYRLYNLLPPTIALSLLLIIAILSAAIAIMQNSRVLIVLAEIGGFITPLLVQGQGDYASLFSYYLVLNFAVAIISWFKSWRLLSYIGFIFTFVIATTWGVLQYQPGNYFGIQIFLILFILLYVFITVMFAARSTENFERYINMSLLFGVPTIGFGLQCTLVKPFEYGYTLSAIAFGLFYIILGYLLLFKSREKFRVLIECCIAIAVIFMTLAIVLTSNIKLTQISWSLEGLLISWFGLRYNRKIAYFFGFGLLCLSYFLSLQPVLDIYMNSQKTFTALGVGLFESIVTLVAADLFHRNNDKSLTYSIEMSTILCMASAAMYGVLIFSYYITESFNVIGAIYLLLFAGILFWYSQKRSWQMGLIICLVMIGSTGLYNLIALFNIDTHQPSNILNQILLLLCLIPNYYLLYRYENLSIDKKHLVFLIMGMNWLILANLMQFAWSVLGLFALEKIWLISSVGLLPLIAVWTIALKGKYLTWPILTYWQGVKQYFYIPLIIIIYLATLYLNIAFWSVNQEILYIPLLNPLDLLMAFSLLTFIYWTYIKNIDFFSFVENQKLILIVIGVWIFFWINSMILKSVHFYANVPYTTEALFNSMIAQVSLTLGWALEGLILMLLATYKKQRDYWLVGGIMLILVILKLTLIDLSGVNSLARVISFIGAGIIFLLIGYFSPIPPKKVSETKNQSTL
jgi:uncharacterized membrane protein